MPYIFAQSLPEIPSGSTFSEWLLAVLVLALVTAIGYFMRSWMPNLLADFKAENASARTLFESQIKAEREMWSGELDKARAHQEKVIDKVCDQLAMTVREFQQTDALFAAKLDDMQSRLDKRADA